MLLAISCSKQPLGTPQLVNAQMTENINRAAINTGHYIGERFGGGIIFWMTPDSMHGLIADTTDLGAFSWEEPSAYTQTNATGTRIGSGKSNTRKIILAQGKKGSYAALECEKSERSGYTDWFLPSKEELNKLYLRRFLVGGFQKHEYWSSSDANNDGNVWLQLFELDGAQGIGYWGAVVNVRAIRAF